MAEITCAYQNIFSIPLFSQKLLLDNKKILLFCDLLKKMDKTGKINSNSGGWQSNKFNINNPQKELEEITKCIFDFSSEICNFLEIENVSCGNYWININGYGHFNWSHIHPNSALSGVYYIKTPNNCGNIEFEHPFMNLMNDMRVKKYNIFNSLTFNVPIEEGMLYIFPGWLSHKVHPNLNSQERVSISFNLI